MAYQKSMLAARQRVTVVDPFSHNLLSSPNDIVAMLKAESTAER